jgi:hypothetical protein
VRALGTRDGVVDQQLGLVSGNDTIVSAGSGLQQSAAPYFNTLCDTAPSLWAQTVTAGRGGTLYRVDLLLLRRSPGSVAPVQLEIRATDGVGLPTAAVLGGGTTAAEIPAHPSEPSWLAVPLDAPVELAAGQKVALFPTSPPSGAGACYDWLSAGTDLYLRGSMAVTEDVGESFRLDRGKDAAFRTWMR